MIDIINENRVLVHTDKGEYEISKGDLQRYVNCGRFSLSGLHQLGRICGDWRCIMQIANDVAYIFNGCVLE